MRSVVSLLPLRLVSLTNMREHWRVRHRRSKMHRQACMAVPAVNVPCTVIITRLGPRMLDDDNLQGACKSVRDGIADRLGVDDADPRISWLYAQEKSKDYAVRIQITERPV